MMIFDWYNLFNLNDFLATGLVSRVFKVTLEGIGQKDILVTRGNEVSIVYEDVILPVLFQGDNPFVRSGVAKHYAIYKDSNSNLYLGIETAQ